MVLNLYRFRQIKKTKCMKCKKKKPDVILPINNELNDLDIVVYCKECFRKEVPEYTLENYCITCNINFKCNIQKSLFSKEEIKAFKKQFWG